MLIGADLVIGALPGRGTRVRLIVPHAAEAPYAA